MKLRFKGVDDSSTVLYAVVGLGGDLELRNTANDKIPLNLIAADAAALSFKVYDSAYAYSLRYGSVGSFEAYERANQEIVAALNEATNLKWSVL
jgi:hypothetical protein